MVGLQTPTSADGGIGRYTRESLEGLEKKYPELVTNYEYEPNLPIERNLKVLKQTGKLRPNSHPEVISGGHDPLTSSEFLGQPASTRWLACLGQ